MKINGQTLSLSHAWSPKISVHDYNNGRIEKYTLHFLPLTSLCGRTHTGITLLFVLHDHYNYSIYAQGLLVYLPQTMSYALVLRYLMA